MNNEDWLGHRAVRFGLLFCTTQAPVIVRAAAAR